MRRTHVHPSSHGWGIRSQQPGSAAALGLSFPSHNVGSAEAAPKASASPTVSEGLGQSRGGGSNWTLVAKGVQGGGQRHQGKRGVTHTGRKDSRWPWGTILFNTSSHPLRISYSYFTDEETEALLESPVAGEGQSRPLTDPARCGHMSGSHSCPSPNCSCPLLFTFLIIKAIDARYRLSGKCRKVRRKCEVQNHPLPLLSLHPYVTYC